MNEVTEHNLQPTLQQLAAEVARLRERVEDLEDARELDAAIRRNAGQPLLRWDDVKGGLGL
jgi:cell division protein FtsB